MALGLGTTVDRRSEYVVELGERYHSASTSGGVRRGEYESGT